MTKPTSIHIILLAGYYFLFALLFAVAGIVYLTSSDWLLKVIPENDYLLQMTPSDFLRWGGVLLVVAGLEALLGMYLLKRSRIAKIIAVVSSGLGLLWAIFGLIAYAELLNVFFLVVHSYFLWVLVYRYTSPGR